MRTDRLLMLTKKAWDMVRDDHAHEVVLDKDYHVGTFREKFHFRDRWLPILDAEIEQLRIRDRELWILATARGDGASCVPDKIGKIDLLVGAIPHDEMYRLMRKLVELPAWREAGWTEPAVRCLADIVLAVMTRREEQRDGSKKETVSRTVYTGVRAFGGIYHKIMGWLGLSLLILALAGCAIPDDVFDPSDDYPVYHIEDRDNGNP